MIVSLQSLSSVAIPASIMAVVASLGAFGFTAAPRSHQTVHRLGSANFSLISFSGALPWGAPGIVVGFVYGVAALIFVFALIEWTRLRRRYTLAHEAHYCFPCGQMQIPDTEPVVCPECGSHIFFKVPAHADNMDRQLAFSENETIRATQWAILRSTVPRALMLFGLLLPIALLSAGVGRAMDHPGFWMLIATLWTIVSFTCAQLVTVGVRTPPEKKAP